MLLLLWLASSSMNVSGLFCGRPDGLELVTRLSSRSDAFCGQFPSRPENFSFLVLLAYTAHKGLCDYALYKSTIDIDILTLTLTMTITLVKSHVNWFRGFGILIPQIQPFSTGLADRPYNSVIFLHCDEYSANSFPWFYHRLWRWRSNLH